MKKAYLLTLVALLLAFISESNAQSDSSTCLKTSKTYASYKDKIDRYQADIRSLQRLSQEYGRQYDEVNGLEPASTPPELKNDKASLLISARARYRDQYQKLGNLVLEILQLPDYDLVASGWSNQQAGESKKWRKIFEPIKNALLSARKVTPDDFEVSYLVYQLNGSWHQ